MAKFTIINHPLLNHKLSYLKQPANIVGFRNYELLVREMGVLLAYEACRELELVSIHSIKNPKEWLNGKSVSFESAPVIVPIVRAGLILAEGVRSIVPSPYLTHMGIFNHPATGKPTEFMLTMPLRTERLPDYSQKKFLIVDMMIGRGKTAEKALTLLNSYGVPYKNIQFLTLIISKEGRKYLEAIEEFSDVEYIAARQDTENDIWSDNFKDINFRMYKTEPHKSPDP